MNDLTLSRFALNVCAAALLLAGCGGSPGTSSTIPGSGMTQYSSRPSSFWPLLSIGAVPARHHHRYAGLRDLYVADPGRNAVEILANGTYKNVGSISNGISLPVGVFLDKKGNLYVANPYPASNIREYAPGGTSPSFTYNTSMFDPEGVSVDGAGNVYEVDYHGGFVNEYAQGTNAVLHSCTLGSPLGVAVDASGDVFVDAVSSSGPFTNIYEYIGGLIKRGHPYRCQPTTLGVEVLFGGGMALDNNNDLVVCDQDFPAVDIIDPPYSSITRTLGSGYFDPFDVTLNKSNALAFVADVGLDEVFVYDYKTNTLVTTLGSGNGLAVPYSAVDGPNAVP
jgi:DNA-binding beta-propeller fold protein YncE